VSSKINVTDQDITDYFAAHKSEFNLIEPQYHLGQIFVTPAPNPKYTIKTQSAERSRRPQENSDARHRLDSGDDFATLAMNYSEDPETSAMVETWGQSPNPRCAIRSRHARSGTQVEARQYSPIITVINPATKQAVGFRIVKLVSKELRGSAISPIRAYSRPFGRTARPARTGFESGLLRSSARLRESGELLREESVG